MSLESDRPGVGVFVKIAAEKAGSLLRLPLGDLANVARFTSCHRYEPFWMVPKAGTRGGEVDKETQYLLCELQDGAVALFVPLISDAFRCSLEGSGEDGLALVAESGDETVVTDSVIGLFVAIGEEPFDLLRSGARSVAAFLQSGRLREEKPLPPFVQQFGWCTWDAFYQEVSQEKVGEGLESFRRGGVTPRLLILDDGWQSVRQFPTGDKRLTAFRANEKFENDLAPTVRMAKEQFGVETFLVWHAMVGYWGGVDENALPGYGVRSISRRYSPGINHYAPTLREWFGTACGTVDSTQIYRFYQDYHRHLRKQGVDGVKVDNQASLEGLTEGGGYGGRVRLMQAYHEALEGSVHTHFSGNVINCMSCANEMIYSTLNSTLTRTSTDFWPNRPESHGSHLYCNAQVSAWFGEFVHPDWDMFQSGHPAGGFHAAGRAVSGGPIYVSDKPGAQNFDLLKKLTLKNGRALVADHPGRPTRDCLFQDPTKDDVLLKIWNHNGSENPDLETAGVVGVFHARYGEGTGPISGNVSPSDVPGLAGERFAVYAHTASELRLLGQEEVWPITLEPLTAEIFTLVPIMDEFAAIGIAEKFNSRATVLHSDVIVAPETRFAIVGVRGEGTFVAYSGRRPDEVEILPDRTADFTYDGVTGMLRVELPERPEDEPAEIHIVWAIQPRPA